MGSGEVKTNTYPGIEGTVEVEESADLDIEKIIVERTHRIIMIIEEVSSNLCDKKILREVSKNHHFRTSR